MISLNFHGTEANTEVHIRQLELRDRPFIEKMVISTGKFNDIEVATALELVNEALDRGGRERISFCRTGVRKKAPRGTGICLLRPGAAHAGSRTICTGSLLIQHPKGKGSVVICSNTLKQTC